MDQSKLQSGKSSIVVHHQGAHLGSWVYQDKEQLFVSDKAIFEPSKAIRGGVPICFPQFGAFGPGKQHGFARNVLWQKVETQATNLLRFKLSHSKESLELWPCKFEAEFDVKINENTLEISLKIKNLNDNLIYFTAALHTYFRVKDIQNILIEGLQSCEYWDNGTAFTQREQEEKSQLQVNQMIDRVYFNTQEPLNLIDGQSTRCIHSTGFADTVIWNPWREGATALADMAADEYQQMICIESANVQTPIQLGKGESWQGQQKITITTL